MIRITLSMLAAALVVAAAATPAPAQTLRNDSQPTACDCSNCSAEHCQPPAGGNSLPLEEVSFSYGKITFDRTTPDRVTSSK